MGVATAEVNGVKRKLNYPVGRKKAKGRSYKWHILGVQLLVPLPKSVDLRKKFPAVWDQADEGSCVAHGTSAIKMACDMRYLGKKAVKPSINDLYYKCREIDGDVGEDSGTTGDTAAQVWKKFGVCSEKLWPYEQKNMLLKPDPACEVDAALHRIDKNYSIGSEYEMKRCLASGYGVGIGMKVPQQLTSDLMAKGRINILRNLQRTDVLVEDGAVAGHYMAVVGYDDKYDAYIVRNSWGDDWCIGGHFWIGADVLFDKYWVEETQTFRLAKEAKFKDGEVA